MKSKEQQEADDFLGGDVSVEPTPESSKKSSKQPEESAQASVRVIKGKWGGQKVPANLPVSERLAPPITRRRIAIYKLTQFENAIDNRIVEAHLNRIEPPPYELVPHYQIFDEYEENITNRNKILEFTDGQETYVFDNPLTGSKENRLRPKPGVPEFRNGIVTVDVQKDYLKYLWMELHPRNASNKRRDMQKTPIFRRVDLDRVNPYLSIIRKNLQGDADNLIRKMSHQQRVNLAAALNLPTTGQPMELEIILRQRAADNAEQVLFTAPDKRGAIRLKIAEAMEHDVLEFHPDLQQWMFCADTTPLLVVMDGKDPVDDLATYLSSDKGNGDYQALVEQLKIVQA